MNHQFSRNEKNLQKQLQQNIELPSIVREKTQTAYHMIETGKVIQKAPPKTPMRWLKTGAGIAGGIAAVLALAVLFCASNPVMARELPLVGSLFERLQNEVSFFGNFSDNATVLKESDSIETDSIETNNMETSSMETNSMGTNSMGTNSMETAHTGSTNSGSTHSDGTATLNDTASQDTLSDGAYTKTSGGLTITFSEFFANSQAIYLTMMVQSEEPFPDTVVSETETEAKCPAISMVYNSTYSFQENPNTDCGQLPLEGIFLDDHTYSCILRLDLAFATLDYTEYHAQQSILSQQTMSEMGITEEDFDDKTEEGLAILSEYLDRMSSYDDQLESYIKEIPLPDSFNLHMDIEEFIGQRAVDPSVYEETNGMSYEETRKLTQYWYEGDWSFDIPIIIDDSQTVIMDINETNENGIGLKSVIKTPYELTFLDLNENGKNGDTYLVALDANGNALPYKYNYSTLGYNYAIQDRDISTVDVYILDYLQYMDELKGEDRYTNNENKPEEEKWSTLLMANAKYHKTLHFD